MPWIPRSESRTGPRCAQISPRRHSAQRRWRSRGTGAAIDRAESWLLLAQKFFAAVANFLFEIVEERCVMFADGIEEAREQKFTGRMGAREETSHQIPRTSAFPFLMGETRRIDESAIGFMAVQETLFEKASESGHYGGVRERPAQFGDDVTYAALSV